MEKENLDRRKFLKKTSLGIIGTGFLSKTSLASQPNKTSALTDSAINFRTLGRTGFRVSDIGIGRPQNETILRAMLSAGLNYIDTSEVYGNGNNEILIGKVLKEFDRKEIFVTTRYSPLGGLGSKEEIKGRFLKSLNRLQTNYIDCYMLHGVSSTKMIKNGAFHSAIKELKEEGFLNYAGASCHGSAMMQKLPETMEEIMVAAAEDGRFDVLLFVYNFIHPEMGNKILDACHKNNVGAIIMKSNPIKFYAQMSGGGTGNRMGANHGSRQSPAMNSDSSIQRDAMVRQSDDTLTGRNRMQNGASSNRMNSFMRTLEEDRVKADEFLKRNNIKNEDKLFRDIATQFVLTNTGVSTILISLSSLEDLEYYLNLSGQKLSQESYKLLNDYNKNFNHLNCRIGCNICESKCPHHVPINTIMRYSYYFTVKGEEKFAMQKYNELQGGKPDSCLNCEGFCEKACPYGVLTRPLLAMAHQNLSLDRPHYT